LGNNPACKLWVITPCTKGWEAAQTRFPDEIAELKNRIGVDPYRSTPIPGGRKYKEVDGKRLPQYCLCLNDDWIVFFCIDEDLCEVLVTAVEEYSSRFRG
jgi:hypothetical protein